MRIALVTASEGPPFMQEVDEPLVATLAAREVEVVRAVWDDPRVPWHSFDAAVVRTTWDYASRRDVFVEWVQQIGEVTAVWNPPEVIRWNTHKSYLLELEERGAPVIPTAWLGCGDTIDLAALLASRGWDDAVIKPAVGSGARGVVRVDVGDPHAVARAQGELEELLAAGDALVQPFLGSIETRGELSVVVIDGKPTHAVRKTPTDGEYRVQRRFRGRYQEEALDPEISALAVWIVEATGADLLQARVDLIADDLGVPQLAELELTEPDLYLTVAPTAANEVADAIIRRVTG